ncbi:hypothetical protein PoB_006817200 [Plakobranchus ocellatus]|uniref:Uncharacterized protein n=1 Tax=Plakobranchus ocellatus TaxID=259542 RepID=A0AAV4DBS4_9GAST|nr:hypothetical protein PoB_006817200 [Plakobranchus ocellatus]
MDESHKSSSVVVALLTHQVLCVSPPCTPPAGGGQTGRGDDNGQTRLQNRSVPQWQRNLSFLKIYGHVRKDGIRADLKKLTETQMVCDGRAHLHFGDLLAFGHSSNRALVLARFNPRVPVHYPRTTKAPTCWNQQRAGLDRTRDKHVLADFMVNLLAQEPQLPYD